MNIRELLKSKTFWTGVAGIVGAAGGYATGSIDMGTAFQTGLVSVLSIFIRDGIVSAQKDGK